MTLHQPLLRVGLYAYFAGMWLGCGAHTRPRASVPAETRNAREERFEPFQCTVSEASRGRRELIEQQANAETLGLPAELDYVRIGRHRSTSHHYVIVAKGTPCHSARDQAACKANVESLEAAARMKSQVFAITTRGDDVELHEGEAVLSFVGAIDTPERAWLALMVHEDADAYNCDDAHGSGHRRAMNGIELATLWTKSSCRPFQRVRTVYHVAPDGLVTRRSETVVEHDAERCRVNAAVPERATATASPGASAAEPR